MREGLLVVVDDSAVARGPWFADEVQRLLPALYGAAIRLTRNDADAQDLVAEAVAKAWLHLTSLKSKESFRGWLFRILANEFISRCRSEEIRSIQEAYDEAAGEEPAFSLFERLHQPFLLWWGANPEQEFLNKLLREDLEQAVDSLPDCFRVVVLLVDLQGFSYHEVAELLEMPIGTVRSRLARARSLLQRSLWRHAADAGLIDSRSPDPKGAS